MADTIVLTFDTPKAVRVGGAGAFGIVSGLANLSVYDTAKTALAALTGLFVPSTGLLRVVTDGTSSGGYSLRWDATSKAFRAYRSAAATGSLALAAPGAAVAITPPASTVAYTNTDAGPITVVITGGTSTHAVIGRTSGSFTSADIGTVNPLVVHLDVGDTLAVTYSVAGTWTKLPYGIYGLTNSAAAVLTEAAASANIGTFQFLAFGQIAG